MKFTILLKCDDATIAEKTITRDDKPKNLAAYLFAILSPIIDAHAMQNDAHAHFSHRAKIVLDENESNPITGKVMRWTGTVYHSPYSRSVLRDTKYSLSVNIEK